MLCDDPCVFDYNVVWWTGPKFWLKPLNYQVSKVFGWSAGNANIGKKHQLKF